MSAHSFDDLVEHVGHELACVTYGDDDENVAVECETCSIVLLDFDAASDGSAPAQASAIAERLGWALLRWAGLAARDGEHSIAAPFELVERFADAVPHSSIPEACAAIRDGMSST